ncbi:hypothetical protein BASA81_007586 [Batrachochytrium salamandrivorans]|nr:hypothetical protein BASA81_007586 [Batrachochytrium salamandrivorans]
MATTTSTRKSLTPPLVLPSSINSEDILLQGQLKFRRLPGPFELQGDFFHSSVHNRWTSRYFLVTKQAMYQDAALGLVLSADAMLLLRDVSQVRYPSAEENEGVNGKLGGLVTSFKNLIARASSSSNVVEPVSTTDSATPSAATTPTPIHTTTTVTSSRFVVELVGGGSLMFQCESLQQCGRWYDYLYDLVNFETREPVVLIKENFQDIRDYYDLGANSALGSGMSGVVKRVTRKSDGKQFAMKTILLDRLSPKQLHALRNEVDILKILDHPHISKLYETYTEPGVCVRLVIELCEGGELFDRLHQRKRFSESWVQKLVYKMVGVLSYLHENHIAHRDLKLENWLFRTREDDDEIVLIDFGLSHKYRVREHMRKKVGTSYYVAPEVLKGDYMGVQADIWSLGVIVYMLLGGCAPYDGKDDEEILRHVSQGKRPNYETGAWRKISNEGKHFIQSMLMVDPDRRITAELALQHPWVLQAQSTLPHHDLDQDMFTSLVRFAKFSTLKRIAMEVVAFSLSHEEIKQLTDVFQEMDSDHNGYVTFGGLKREVAKHFKITDEELQRVFDALDDEHSGRVHVNEFVAATMQFKYHLEEKHLKQAFSVLDQDNTGFITVEDLKKLLGRNVSDARALEMITLAEELSGQPHHVFGQPHKLSFQDFLAFCRKDGEAVSTATPVTALRKTPSRAQN